MQHLSALLAAGACCYTCFACSAARHLQCSCNLCICRLVVRIIGLGAVRKRLFPSIYESRRHSLGIMLLWRESKDHSLLLGPNCPQAMCRIELRTQQVFKRTHNKSLPQNCGSGQASLLRGLANAPPLYACMSCLEVYGETKVDGTATRKVLIKDDELMTLHYEL